MSVNDEANDDLDIVTTSLRDFRPLPVRPQHRRSESELTGAFTFPRPPNSAHPQTEFEEDMSQSWGSGHRGGSNNKQPQSFGSGNTPLYNKHRSSAALGLFGTGVGGRRRFGSTSSPHHGSSQSGGLRSGRHGWKSNNDSNASAEDDGKPKLVSLSDLIRKEDKVPATLYEHGGDTDVVMDSRDVGGMGGLPQQVINGGTVLTQDALQAAEHGNSIRLSKFLQDGGDPATVSRLHHNRWTLLHLAAGCAMMGGRLSFAFRSRPEPDCNDGYTSCVKELLAAGADPNVSSQHGFTPLMSAALTGSHECCILLLRAGAQLDRKSDDGRTAYDFALKAKHVGGGSMGGPRGSVVTVLRDPPKKVPRSPILVRATLTERSRLESEDAVPHVEVRWRVPSQASLSPAVCGDVERYYVKCFCRGKGKEVLRIPPLVVDVPCTRRDFCRNQIIDRGIALRKNLCLPQSQTASVIVHGLQAGDIYSFTVSCVAEVEGTLRQSPPSCKSKPLLIPESKEDHQWRLGGMLSMVTGKESPSSSSATEAGAAQAQARRVVDQSPNVVDQRRGQAKNLNVSWAKDDIGSERSLRHADIYGTNEDDNSSPSGGLGSFGRSLPHRAKEWDSTLDPPVSRSPARRRSQSYASSSTRPDPFVQLSASRVPSFRSSLGGGQGPNYSPNMSPLERENEARYSFHDTSSSPKASPAPRSAQEREERSGRGSGLSSDRPERAFHTRDHHNSFQDEGCSIS